MPTLLRHRVLLALLYGCGLRRFELLNIKLFDVDFTEACYTSAKAKDEKTGMFLLANSFAVACELTLMLNILMFGCSMEKTTQVSFSSSPSCC